MRRTTDVSGVLAYVALALVVTSGYLAAPHRVISEHMPADNTWFEWLLGHGAYCVRHLANPLVSYRQNVPGGVNMMANTSVLGMTIPLAPLTLLAGVQVAYVVWLIAGLAGTAVTAYWALGRHLVASRAAAFLGGAVAGFAPAVVRHANGQPNFVSNFLLPPIVVAVVRLADEHWRRAGLVLGLLVTWQLFINEELLLLTAGVSAAVLVAHVRGRRAEAIRAAKGLGVAALVALGLGGYPLWVQFAGPQSYRQLPLFHDWGEDLAAFVTPAHESLGGVATGEWALGDKELNTWYGWPLLLAVFVLTALTWRKSRAARVATVIALAGAVGALGPRIRVDGHLTGVPGLWALIPERLPVIGMMMPSRLAFAVTGALAVLVALGWDELARRARDGGRPADRARLGQVAVAAVLVTVAPVPLATVRDEPPPVFITSGAWRRYVPAGTTMVPVPLPDAGVGRVALSWSAIARLEFPVPRGYFLGPDANGDARMGAAPGRTAQLISDAVITGHPHPLTPADRAGIRADLARWHASAVVLDPAETRLKPWLDGILGPAQRVDDVWLWDVRGD